MDLKESLPSATFRSLLIHSVCSRDAALFIKYYGQQPSFLDWRTRNSKFAIDLDFQNEVPQSKKDFTLGRKLNLFRILEYARAAIPRGWLMAYLVRPCIHNRAKVTVDREYAIRAKHTHWCPNQLREIVLTKGPVLSLPYLSRIFPRLEW